MKRIILAIAIMALVFSAAQRVEAGTDVSIDFFYNNLNEGGNWIEAGDYGYCWQPSVAVSNPRWRPYSDGYWAYTDVGWTWVSYEDFGWATYHYGRWTRLRDQGWVWVPGREWGPAWVSWRTGGDQVGWAPLPPRYGGGRNEIVYEGRSISNTVDIDFDIGPSYYNFVDVRYIGDPVLRERIYEPSQNIAYINGTVNVTNISYSNSRFYNYGPDYNQLSAYSTRPIQRMTLEHQTNVDFNTAAPSGGFTRVQGDRLVVAAPQLLQAPAPQQQLAPKTVKTRIATPEVETGWTGITDSKAKAELQQKIKKEDPKSIPPAKLQPTNPAALTAAPVAPNTAPPPAGAIAPAAVAPPSGVALPDARGKGKDKRGALAPTQPGASPAPGLTDPNTAAVPGSPNDTGQDKNKSKHGGNKPVAQPLVSQPDGTPVPDAPAIAAPVPNKDKGKNRGNSPEVNAQPGQPPVAAQAGSATSPAAELSVPAKPAQNGKGKNKSERFVPTQPGQPAIVPESAGAAAIGGTTVPPNATQETGKGKGKQERRPAPALNPAAAPASAPSQALPKEQAPSGKRQMQQAPPQQVAPSNGQPAPQKGGGKSEKGKKNKQGEEEPAAPPGQ